MAYLWECAFGEDAADELARVASIVALGQAELMSGGYLHQQASLTAGSITYNNELSTDFRHSARGRLGGRRGSDVVEVRRSRASVGVRCVLQVGSRVVDDLGWVVVEERSYGVSMRQR